MRGSLGAFLLDALDPTEQAAVARHVERCPACSHELDRMAALPALLASVPVDEVAEAAEPRVRRHGLTAAICITLLLVLAGGAELGRHALRPTASASDAAADVRLAATVAANPWGAGVEMRLSGVPAGERCRLVVRAADGRRDVAARWRATYAGTAAVRATTAIAAGDVSELSVVTDDGRVLVRAHVD